MQNDASTQARDDKVNRLFRTIAGVGFLITGIAAICVSTNVIPYVDLHPNRIEIFNDPHTWEVFMLGMLFTSLGVATILPPNWKLIGRLNRIVLLISLIAVVVGVVFEKK
ncbi:MAG: hypothetical protein FJ220_05485 [Kiritimatiellaceae bacterium]|nr:hypothetical protein [Kiritimatiellaceae bacterium]